MLSSTATVTVTVTDTNDNAPTFDQESYTATISEMANPGTLVTTIVAKDRDSGTFGENGIVYQLSGNGAEKFIVNNRTGTVTVAECEHPGNEDCLDYETKSEYLLSFKVSQLMNLKSLFVKVWRRDNFSYSIMQCFSSFHRQPMTMVKVRRL